MLTQNSLPRPNTGPIRQPHPCPNTWIAARRPSARGSSLLDQLPRLTFKRVGGFYEPAEAVL